MAARPSKGKTSFVLNLALNAARKCKSNEYVIIFSLEMDKKQLFQRLIQINSGISYSINNVHSLGQQDYDKLQEHIKILSQSNIIFSDSANLDINKINCQLKKIVSDNKKIRLVVVDYLQLINSATKSRRDITRAEEVGVISHALKTIALDFNTPVIACSQLSRDIEQRKIDKIPRLSDLRESGSIEQDADIVSFLCDMNSDYEGKIKDYWWYLAKHRNGPIGKVPLKYYLPINKFVNPDYVRSK